MDFYPLPGASSGQKTGAGGTGTPAGMLLLAPTAPNPLVPHHMFVLAC